MALQTPNSRKEQDEAFSPYSPKNLASAERFMQDGKLDAVGHRPTETTGDEATSQAAATKNINDADKQERQPSINRGFINNFTGKPGGKKQFSTRRLVVSKGPTGLIISLAVGGSVGIGGILAPDAALVHIKEVVVGKMDSLTSVNETRAYIGLKKRMFSTTSSCTIKVRCRYSGLSKNQMDRLKRSGAQLLDKDGKEVKPRKIGGITRYSGGQTLVFSDAAGQEHRIDARGYKKALRTNAALRDLSRSVHPSKWTTLGGGKVIQKFRSVKKLTTDQKWGKEGDEKEARKAIHQAQVGESAEGQVNVQDDAERDKDGNLKDKTGAEIDMGEYQEDVERKAAETSAKLDAGERVAPVPTDPAAVLMADDPKVGNSARKVFNKALSFVSPLSFVTGMCTVYQVSYAMVLAAKTIVLERAMRFAASTLSTLDKIKYNVATSDEVEKIMKIFQRQDEFGNDFGDAVGYQYPAYGIVPDIAITSSATGNETIRMLTGIINYIDENVPGGGHFVRTTCKVVTNPIVMGGLALTSFIPGAGLAVKSVTKVIGNATETVAKKKVQAELRKIIEKKAAKAAGVSVKSAARSAGKGLWKIAKSPFGIFLGSMLLQKYAVLWGSQLLSAADYTYDSTGVTAMDATTNGLDATVSGAGSEGGMQPLTKEEYKHSFKPFNDASQATYIADQRAKSNPFNLYDPYSAGNSLASSLYMFSSKLNLKNGTANLLSLPATVLSSLNPTRLLSGTALADDVDVDSTFCKDDPYLDEKDLASSPFCNVKKGFGDVSMLENADPDTDVSKEMLNTNQIDENGEPVPGSHFADFKAKCVDGSSDKIISNLGAGEQQLDPECYSKKNQSAEWKRFRLFIIDSNIADDMDTVKLNNTDPKSTNTDEAAFYQPQTITPKRSLSYAQ